MTGLQKVIFTLLIGIVSTLSYSSTNLNLEFGQANNTYNKVKINGEDGTLFNLAPALDSTFYYRLSLIKKFSSSHGFRLLYAPLKLRGEKRFSKNITFNGVSFPAGRQTEAEYQFNSYRATYFYEAITKDNFFLRLGGTLKIRDALIELKQDNRKKVKKNIGLVPLLYLNSQYSWENDIFLTFDFDGLMAPQGRAFDVALMAGYSFNHSYSLSFGYRILDGGADNEEVYNFSQINYLFTAFQMNF